MIVAATITFSDTRTEADDEGGRLLRERLVLAGCDLAPHAIVKDDDASVRTAFSSRLRDPKIELIVSTGGTGVSPRDRVPDVLAALLTQELVGFGEAFRRLSWDQVGPRAMLSRAIAGVANETLIVALPGSVKAVRLGVDDVLAPLIPHVIDVINGRTAHR